MAVEALPATVSNLAGLPAYDYVLGSEQLAQLAAQEAYDNYMPEGGLPSMRNAMPAYEAGYPVVDQVPTAPEGPANMQFLSLLESLEARVDLMSQMQHAREAIQKRATAMQALKGNDTDEAAMCQEGFYPQHAVAQGEFNCNAAETAVGQYAETAGLGADAYDCYPEQNGIFPEGDHCQPLPSQQYTLEDENTELWSQLKDQRDCIAKLTGEVEGMRRQLFTLGTQPPPGSEQLVQDAASSVPASAVSTTLLQEAAPRSLLAVATPQGPPVTPAFNQTICGVNLAVSEDGYIATRTRGCRQSVAIGSEPLKRQASGWYFEVEIRETVAGWVGGLGIGVTTTQPTSLRRVPDKAWRIPKSFMVGYWGCIFMNGVESRTDWRPDSLCSGSRVGFLVTGDGLGDLVVFVNGRPTVRVEGAMREAFAECAGNEELLYPIVDVFAATREVALDSCSVPPPPPWHVDQLQPRSPVSRPRSPGGRSMCTSVAGASVRAPPSMVGYA